MDNQTMITLYFLAAFAGLYFLPTIIAFGRDLVNAWSIFILNLFLGWTLLGWVIPLAMAASGTAAKKA